MLVLLEAQEGEWDEIDLMMRRFQQRDDGACATADVPVVVAPSGLTLGGGCGIACMATAFKRSGETYMGLVEVGVGLIPGGGGTGDAYVSCDAQSPTQAE